MAATTREWFEGSPDDIAESFSRVISNPAFFGKDVLKNLQDRQASILKRTEFWRELVGLQRNLAFQKSKILKGFRKLVHMKKWEMTDEEIEDFIGKATTRTMADASILKNAYQKNRHTLWIQPIFGKGDTGGRTKDDGAGVGLLAEFDAAAEEEDETAEQFTPDPPPLLPPSETPLAAPQHADPDQFPPDPPPLPPPSEGPLAAPQHADPEQIPPDPPPLPPLSEGPLDTRVKYHAGWHSWVVTIKDMDVMAKFKVSKGGDREMEARRARAFLKELDALIVTTGAMQVLALINLCKDNDLTHSGVKKSYRAATLYTWRRSCSWK